MEITPVLKNFHDHRPKNIEQRMAMALLLSEEVKLVSLIGKQVQENHHGCSAITRCISCTSKSSYPNPS